MKRDNNWTRKERARILCRSRQDQKQRIEEVWLFYEETGIGCSRWIGREKTNVERSKKSNLCVGRPIPNNRKRGAREKEKKKLSTTYDMSVCLLKCIKRFGYFRDSIIFEFRTGETFGLLTCNVYCVKNPHAIFRVIAR